MFTFHMLFTIYLLTYLFVCLSVCVLSYVFEMFTAIVGTLVINSVEVQASLQSAASRTIDEIQTVHN